MGKRFLEGRLCSETYKIAALERGYVKPGEREEWKEESEK
jgi:hypothetical protein